jgi:hypothetical protein
MKAVPFPVIERILEDSRASTLTHEDELAYIRLILRCLAAGFSYEDALVCTHVQLSEIISGE